MKKMFIRLGILLTIGLYAQNDALYQLDTFIENPSAALQDVLQLNRNLQQEQEKIRTETENSIEDFIARNKELFHKYEQQSPIFGMGECTHYIVPCCLSRLESPHIRKGFETQVVAMVDALIPKIKERPVEYVGFGSGGMFQDLVILTKFLKKHPQAHINVHLIDPAYRVYVDSCNLMGEAVVQVTTPTKNFQSVLDQIIFQAQEEGAFKEDSQNKLRADFATWYMNCEQSGVQFLKWIKSQFPQANVMLFLHLNTEKYISYVESYQKSYPDIIVAADIMDEMSMLRNSCMNLIFLIVTSQKKNQNSVNAVLSDGQSDKAPGMMGSFSLEVTPGAIPMTFANDNDGGQITVYMTGQQPIIS